MKNVPLSATLALGLALSVVPLLQSPAAVLSGPQFQRLLGASLRSGRPLELKGRTVDLGTLELKVDTNGAQQVIQGPGLIRGSGHSLIQVGGNRNSLMVTATRLHHAACAERSEKAKTGAALWIRGKAKLVLRDCEVTSEAGYGAWLVQRGAIDAAGCHFYDCGRSGVVLFGQSRAVLGRGTVISRPVLHGICARGETVVEALGVAIEGCGLRGVYAYHSAVIMLQGCTVARTEAADCSAIQVEALRPGDCASLGVRDCILVDNRGLGLSVAGNATCKIVSSPLSLKGRLVIPSCEDPGAIGLSAVNSRLSATEQLHKHSQQCHLKHHSSLQT